MRAHAVTASQLCGHWSLGDIVYCLHHHHIQTVWTQNAQQYTGPLVKTVSLIFDHLRVVRQCAKHINKIYCSSFTCRAPAAFVYACERGSVKFNWQELLWPKEYIHSLVLWAFEVLPESLYISCWLTIHSSNWARRPVTWHLDWLRLLTCKTKLKAN